MLSKNKTKTTSSVSGADIKSLRKKLGLTQVEFASLLGVAPNTVARWERGEIGLSHSTEKLFSMLRSWSSPKDIKRKLQSISKSKN